MQDIANQFTNAQAIMHEEWLRENNVTLDECGSLCDRAGAIIRGFLNAPEHIRMTILACSATDDKQMAETFTHVIQRRETMKRLSQ